MAYEFRKIYQVAAEAGCEISSDTSLEKLKERFQKAKEWFDSTFPDIFETGKLEESGSNIVNLKIYFKGTNMGIYIKESSNIAYCAHGYFNGDTQTTVTGTSISGKLRDNSLNLFVIKSKYGFITGFYKTSIGDIKTLVINGETRLLPVIADTDKKNLYIADGSSATVQSGLMASSNSDVICLTQFCPPGTDYIPEGIYINQCAGVKNCAVYTVGSGSEKYAELSGGDGYISFALKLEEPTEEDYREIKATHGSEV